MTKPDMNAEAKPGIGSVVETGAATTLDFPEGLRGQVHGWTVSF
jgi:hypothetical protein